METDFLLIIEQSEADEEAALKILGDDDEVVKETKKVHHFKETRKILSSDDDDDELKVMKRVHDPTFKKTHEQQQHHVKFISLLQKQHASSPTKSSFVVEYNWNIPQLVYNPSTIKHMLMYG